jgi:hypothetical protein
MTSHRGDGDDRPAEGDRWLPGPVIVVSHQEVFQDRSLFPAVFELRREDRETVARSI